MKEKTKVILIISAIALVLGCFAVVCVSLMEINDNEIYQDQYIKVDKWVDEFPSVKPVVLKAIEDGKITREEYKSIREESVREDKAIFIDKLREKLR